MNFIDDIAVPVMFFILCCVGLFVAIGAAGALVVLLKFFGFAG